MAEHSSGSGSGRGDHGTTAPVALRRAVEQLGELIGKTPESVSALQPRDEGWTADVEVVEVQRIPDTTSVLASYRVTLDADGALLGYEQRRRYTRGQIDRE